MDTLIHADIFFFITSIAVILVTSALVVVLIYLIQILKDFKQVSHRVKEETGLLSQDLAQLRSEIRKEGMKLKHFADFFSRITSRKKGRAQKK